MGDLVFVDDFGPGQFSKTVTFKGAVEVPSGTLVTIADPGANGRVDVRSFHAWFYLRGATGGEVEMKLYYDGTAPEDRVWRETMWGINNASRPYNTGHVTARRAGVTGKVLTFVWTDLSLGATTYNLGGITVEGYVRVPT